MQRKDFLKKAGAGTAAAFAVPSVLTTEAFAAAGQHGTRRIYNFVSISGAPATSHIKAPLIYMEGCGNFDPQARTVSGGGNFFFYNGDPAIPPPKPLIAFGRWFARSFVNYDTKGLPPYAINQPAILEMLVDLEGIGSGLTLEVVCNVGPARPGRRARKKGGS
jgi:hypothetical protein